MSLLSWTYRQLDSKSDQSPGSGEDRVVCLCGEGERERVREEGGGETDRDKETEKHT